MNKLLLLVTLVLLTGVTAAQQTTTNPSGLAAQENLNQLGSDNVSGIVRVFDSRYDGIKGTPFFLPFWSKATLGIGDKLIYENLDLKYNVYENNLLYRKPDRKELVFEAQNVSYFILKDSLGINDYVFKKLTYDPKLANQFFLILYEGSKKKLVMLPKRKMIKADYKGGYASGRNYDELVNESTYFLVHNNTMQKVKLNRKNLLNVLSDKQSEVQAFLAKEKVDATTEQGWSKTLAYYETL